MDVYGGTIDSSIMQVIVLSGAALGLPLVVGFSLEPFNRKAGFRCHIIVFCGSPSYRIIDLVITWFLNVFDFIISIL